MVKIIEGKSRFSRVEILTYIFIFFLLFLAIFLFIRGIRAETRDQERKEEIGILEEAIQAYFEENGKYLIVEEWECLEKKNYFPETPKDPLYDPSRTTFCYHYKSADEGKEYKLYATLEKEKKAL